MAHSPYLKVTRGDPTPEELAALIAVLTLVEDPGEATPEPPRSLWSDAARTTRRSLPTGRDAWRSSGWTS
ncbi:acyl-CoA carboxylase subunit epsilon [Sphaerisporangium sp. B11E5]|uniref:acyl-CoA carboxylase subunit epsilon n=1 Tax=Sphaerisporangium sp. B11E5 TaxID=3153563 RepID=UPI00325DAC99